MSTKYEKITKVRNEASPLFRKFVTNSYFVEND